MSPTRAIVGLGEILWDLLPSGKLLGGAPFNFTFHCHQLGHPCVMVSRVGVDTLGTEILAHLRERSLDDSYVQRDARHATGTVPVSIDARGQPTFTITPNVAYDFLAWDDRMEALMKSARAVCFGTLIQRHEQARATVQRALQAARGSLIVYDVNLRQHFYGREIIEASLHASRWVKLNDSELTVLRDLLELREKEDVPALAEMRHRYRLELACLTRGEHGCLVQTDADQVDLAGIPVRVVDTIGAGDAFTAGLLVSTLEGKPLAEAARFANRLAARVAGSAGGTPRIDRPEVETP
jgi:fructokinase